MTSAFLASLAISDLVTIFFAIPSHLVSLLSTTWNLLGNFNVGLFACKIVTYMEDKFLTKFLPPANEVCEGNVFTGVCVSMEQGVLSRGGLCPGGLCPRVGVSVQGWGSLSKGGVSVQGRGSLSKGGGLCPRKGVSVWGNLCPEESLSRCLCPGVPVQRGVFVQGVFVLGGLCPGVSVRETPSTVKSGRYTSYWNAFFFIMPI